MTDRKTPVLGTFQKSMTTSNFQTLASTPASSSQPSPAPAASTTSNANSSSSGSGSTKGK